MIHISKDPFVPIRKNVTFIPFRIGGAVELVTGPVIATGSEVGKGQTKNRRMGNENIRFYL